ncbi:macro domain-containing protein [Pantoea ananatis]|uniref:macro domain-containing protein n=1 Tax=Pantoea ananas TaxID=553 RepID=UPI001B305C4C|nr:macro domain-containing protein [Pantoea ananatis]
MIEFVEGDFFDFDADIRINTVNCVGVMGAGVALLFKNKYPKMYKEYVRQCKNNEISPGNPTVWKEGDMFSASLEIINFPTKAHWKNPSEYEYIDKGLIWLEKYLKDKKGLTITLPALGCGHGGLDWRIVKKMIISKLSSSDNRILVFNPKSSREIKNKNSLSSNQLKELDDLHISTIKINSHDYPKSLSRYTTNNIYFIGEKPEDYDISIIASTNPDIEEKKFIMRLLDFCESKKLSILFGGSSFDKKVAFYSLKKGVKTGMFLPCGITKSAEKLKKNVNPLNISIFSTGNPFNNFDKKEYLPSVMSRIFMAKTVFLTTGNLLWLENQKYYFLDNKIKSYFLERKNIEDKDFFAATKTKSKPIHPDEDFEFIDV